MTPSQKLIQITITRQAADDVYNIVIDKLEEVAKDFQSVGYGEVEWHLDRARSYLDIIDAVALALSEDDEKGGEV